MVDEYLARAITRAFLVSERETMRYVKLVTNFTLKACFHAVKWRLISGKHGRCRAFVAAAGAGRAVFRQFTLERVKKGLHLPFSARMGRLFF